MLVIMNSQTGKIVGKTAMAYDPDRLDIIRNIINRETDFSYSLIWENEYV